MNDQYKKDEKIMKDILKQHVNTNNENEKLELIIYYSNVKTKNLIMKNNSNKTTDKMRMSWVVYEYKCPRGDCELPNPSYIGQTRNTIRTRLQQHEQDGAIKQHIYSKHKDTVINTTDLEENTKPVKQFRDIRRLYIYEALLILQERPDINRQKDNFINPLKLFGRTTHTHTLNNTQEPSTQQSRYNLRSNTQQ